MAQDDATHGEAAVAVDGGGAGVSLDTFDLMALPALNKPMVLELAGCEFVVARENIMALGDSGAGKTHIALSLGLAACQRGFSVAVITAASRTSQWMASSDQQSMRGIDCREKA